MKNHTWILGSKSPRRSELLAGIGCAFEVRTKDTPENYPKELALEKDYIRIEGDKAIK